MRADLTAILRQGKRDICMFTNIHNAAAEGNFCNEGGKAIKLQIEMDYNHHMGYVVKGDRMANSYSLSCPTSKWTKKTVLSSLRPGHSQWLYYSRGSKKSSHGDFRYILLRSMLAHAGAEWRAPMSLMYTT